MAVKRDTSKTINIHGDKYTYDADKKKWMSGKKEATAIMSITLDMILRQMQAKPEDEAVSFVGKADVPDEDTKEKEKQISDVPESEEPTPAKPETLTEESLKPEPEVVTEEPTSDKPEVDSTPTPQPKRPASGLDALIDAKENVVSMAKDYKNWFKPEERKSLRSMEDLSASEKRRLQKRGVDIDTEAGKAAKDEQELTKEQVLEELNFDAVKREEGEETPFYKKKASELSQDFGTAFNKRLGEKLPLLKLFSDKFDGEDEDAIGITGGGNASISGFSDSIVDSLKSIDDGVQDIIGILRENQDDEEKDDTQKESDKQDAEVEKEKTRENKTASDVELEPSEEKDRGFAYNLGKKTKQGINNAKEGVNKIKSKMGLGESGDVEGAAEAVGSEAVGLEGVAGAAGAAEGAVGLAEGAAGLAAAPELLAGLGAAAVVGGLGYGAYKLFGGGDDTSAPSAEPTKPAITDQTNTLNQADDERKRRDSNKNQNPATGTTVINNTTNNTGGGGNSNAVVPTAGNRNSLDLYYFAA